VPTCECERVGIVARLTPREGLALVEMLKAIVERKAAETGGNERGVRS